MVCARGGVRRVVANVPGRDRQPAVQQDDGGGDLEEVIRAGPHGHFLVEAVVTACRSIS